MIATVLENAGASVRAAASAEDARMVLQTWQPQVMISDIEMQGQDGYELMQSVRLLSGNRQRLVAVALTAHARPEDRLRALEAGFQWHLTKPIDPRELVGVIVSLVVRPARSARRPEDETPSYCPVADRCDDAGRVYAMYSPE